MLNENIKTLRKKNGLSQEELAVKLNVVRQTVSKWETGLSVPDADMLSDLSCVFGVSVSTILGEEIETEQPDGIKAIAAKLEVINLQLIQLKEERRKHRLRMSVAVCALLLILGAVLALMSSPYLNFDYSEPEYAVIGTVYHALEWVFFRTAPFLLAIFGGIAVFSIKK